MPFETIEQGIESLRTKTCASFRLEDNSLYIPLLGTSSSRSKDTTDLEISLRDFTSNMNPKRTCVLYGDGGSGKSSFLQQLTLTLWEEYTPDKPIPLFISLPLLTDPIAHAVEEHLENHGFSAAQITELKNSHSFNFIFDGYDEIHQLENLYETNHLQTWNAKTIISCRTQYFYNKSQPNLYFMPLHRGIEQPHLLQTLHVASFNQDQIERYLTVMRERGIAIPSYVEITKIPGLQEIITTPFLLHLTVKALPDILARYSDSSLEEQHRLTQTDLYKIFVRHWFERQEIKLTESGHITAEMPDRKPVFWRYCQALALKMHEHNLTWLNTQDPNFEVFFESDIETEMLRSACPLTIMNEKIGFWHQSLGTHFVGQSIYQEAFKVSVSSRLAHHSTFSEQETSLNSPFSTSILSDEKPKGTLHLRLVTDDPAVLRALADDIETDLNFKKRMLEIIECSKHNQHYVVGAANAISALNVARVSFSGMNFQGIRVPYANLNGAILDHTDLSGADLSYVVLQNAFLNHADFNQSKMQNVSFGEQPYLAFPYVLGEIRYSADGHWLAIRGERCRGIMVKDMTSGATHHWDVSSLWIDSIAFSTDNQILACSTGSNVTLWKAPSWDFYKKLPCLTMGEIYHLNFSSDGKFLAAGGRENHVELLLLNQSTYPIRHKILMGGGVSAHRFEEQWKGTLSVWCIAFSPNSQILASAGDDEIIHLWDVLRGGCPLEGREQLFGHENFINALAFSPDGTLLASGGGDQTVRLWNVDTGMLLANHGVLNHESDVYCLAFSPDGKQLAVGTQDAVIHLWQITDYGTHFIKEKVLQGHTSTVKSLSFSPNGKVLTSASKDHTLRHWELDQELSASSQIKKYGHTKSIYSLSFNQQGRLASGGGDNTAQLWDIYDNQPLIRRDMLEHKGSINNWIISVAFSPDGKYLASRSWDRYMVNAEGVTIVRVTDKNTGGVISLWALETGQLFSSWSVNGEHMHYNVSFSQNGRFLAWGDKKEIQIATMNPDGPSHILSELKGHDQEVQWVTFNPSSDLLASACRDGMIGLWNVATKQFLTLLRGHTSAVFGVTFNPSGALLASNSGIVSSIKRFDTPTVEHSLSDEGDFSIRIWDVNTGRRMITLMGHKASVLNSTFSLDGQLLASASVDKTVRIWATNHWHMLYVIELQVAALCIAFNHLKTLVVGTDDQAIRLFIPKYMNEKLTYLLMKTTTPILATQGINIETALGLSEPNQLLLTQGNNARPIESEVIIPEVDEEASRLHSDAFFFQEKTAELKELATTASQFYPTSLFSNHTTFRSQATGGISSMAFSSDSQLLVSGGSDKITRLWNVESNQLIAKRGFHHGKVCSVVFSPDNQLIATRAWGRRDSNFPNGEWDDQKDKYQVPSDICLWDVSTGKFLCAWTAKGDADSRQNVLFSPDGKLLAWADSHSILLIRADRALLLSGDIRGCWAVFEKSIHDVQAIAFSPDSCLLASGSKDQTVQLWDLQTTFIPQGPRGTINVHGDTVWSVAFSPDGLHLASGAGEKNPMVCLSTIAPGGYVMGQTLLEGHRADIYSVVFSPDGLMLASGSIDNTVRLWTVSSEQLYAVIDLGAAVSAVTFSSSGMLAVSLQNNNKIHMFTPKHEPMPNVEMLSASPHHQSSGIPGFSMEDMIAAMMNAWATDDSDDSDDSDDLDKSHHSEHSDETTLQQKEKTRSGRAQKNISPTFFIRSNHPVEVAVDVEVEAEVVINRQEDPERNTTAVILLLCCCCPCIVVGTPVVSAIDYCGTFFQSPNGLRRPRNEEPRESSIVLSSITTSPLSSHMNR